MSKILRKEIIAPVVIIFLCMFLCIISKKIIKKIFNLKITGKNDKRKQTIVNLISNLVKFIIVLISIFTVLEVYGIDTKSLVASFGVVGLVAGLSLQDVLKDFIVGASIVFEGQFSIGDWVSINGFKGEIIPSNLRTTKIKANTGEIKMISNRNIVEVTNYSLGDTNLFIDVGVAYESDIKKVKEVLDNLCEKLKKQYKIKNICCLGVQELQNSSINFRLVVQSGYVEQFDLDRKIKEQIVLEFNKNNITIPYDQVVVHDGKRV